VGGDIISGDAILGDAISGSSPLAVSHDVSAVAAFERALERCSSSRVK